MGGVEGARADVAGSAPNTALLRQHKMKARRGFLPAGQHRSRHHHSQYIRGKQVCREHERHVVVDCGISRASPRTANDFLPTASTNSSKMRTASADWMRYRGPPASVV